MQGLAYDSGIAELPPLPAPSTTMLLSLSWSQVLLWVCSADSAHGLIWK